MDLISRFDEGGNWLSLCQPPAIDGFNSTFMLGIAAVQHALVSGDESSSLILHLQRLLS
jgi:hypothetical protein